MSSTTGILEVSGAEGVMSSALAEFAVLWIHEL